MDKQKRNKYLFVGFVIVMAGVILFGINSLVKQLRHHEADDSVAIADARAAAIVNRPMHPLITANACSACHGIDRGILGPSYLEVAERYKDGSEKTRKMLVGKIIEGGTGNWGSLHMLPHPRLSNEDARAMVDWILALNDPEPVSATPKPPAEASAPPAPPANDAPDATF